MDLIIFYLIKRIFLFFDEWFFYIMLYILYRKKCYKLIPFIITFGGICIYTSYVNINMLEKSIIDLPQHIIYMPNLIEHIYPYLQ